MGRDRKGLAAAAFHEVRRARVFGTQICTGRSPAARIRAR